VSTVKLVPLTAANLGRVQMLCGHSPTYKKGYNAKLEWMAARLNEGLRYTLVQVDGGTAGMMEYVPAEYAWRGVDADGYLLIHCFWVVGRNRGHGYGRMLLDACLEDAAGTNGVAVMVSKAHWLPTPKLFLKNGFELADHVDPSFDLLVKRLKPGASLPRFKRSRPGIPPGLTLYKSDQCPYTQNVADIVTRVGGQLKIPVNIIHLDSASAARNSPCPCGTLAYYYDGEFLTYHPAGTEKLLEMLAARTGQ